jgi:hypothetical protein
MFCVAEAQRHLPAKSGELFADSGGHHLSRESLEERFADAVLQAAQVVA